MSDDQLSEADRAFLRASEDLAKRIASKALLDAFERFVVPKDAFLEDTFLDADRIRAIAEGNAEDITLAELLRIAIALDMVVNVDFEPLR